jgi:plastocyanin
MVEWKWYSQEEPRFDHSFAKEKGKTMRIRVWIPILLLLLPALAACGATTSPGGATATVAPAQQPTQEAATPTTAPAQQATQPAATAQVAMKDISFQPKQITVAVGTTVVWTNEDPTSHTVTSGTRGNPSGLFDSGDVAPGQTFSFTFNEPGTYDYYCKIHGGMDGVIIVQ